MSRQLVRRSEDLRIYAGIGEAISAAIREIVETGTLQSLEKLRSRVSPELASFYCDLAMLSSPKIFSCANSWTSMASTRFGRAAADRCRRFSLVVLESRRNAGPHEYLAAENHILRTKIKGRLHCQMARSAPWPRSAARASATHRQAPASG